MPKALLDKNKSQYSHVGFALKAINEAEGIIEGLASTFGNVDSDNETFARGAFKKTIAERGGKGKIIPILDSHDRREQIGWNIEARETDEGLVVRGELDIENNPRARAKYSIARRGLDLGADVGLSIGFRPIKYDIDEDQDMLVTFTEVKLMEYSLVAFPANPMAMVQGVKGESAGTAGDAKQTDEQINISLFIDKYKELTEVYDHLIAKGHEFSDSEIIALSEYRERLETLFEPPERELEGTLKAVEALTAKLIAASA